CPVIASIGGASAGLIVAEPTVSGKHDMERVSELAAFFKVPAMLCVNKFDLNPERGKAIETFAEGKNVKPIGRGPFAPGFTRAMVAAKTLEEFNEQGEACRAIKAIWEGVANNLG
ncbi:MAG: (4Fe-4S)-binding protein, partial [Deltaproteobacteria bacterium]|nr:(4Fe-4S)-binding protein [Deltaproteobacteria bacterium]